MIIIIIIHSFIQNVSPFQIGSNPLACVSRNVGYREKEQEQPRSPGDEAASAQLFC